MKLRAFQNTIFLLYTFIVVFIFYLIFFEIGVDKFTNLEYIKEKSLLLEKEYLKNNLFSKTILIIVSTLYVFCLGIYFPLVVIFGFIFGPIIGTILVNLSTSVGSLLLYIFAKNYFSDFSYFKKFESIWLNKFRKNEFIFIFLFRLFGGGGLPSNIQNLLPLVFKVKEINYFFGTFLGQLPGMFVVCNLIYQIKNTFISNEKLSFSIFNDIKVLSAFFMYGGLIFLLFVFRKKLNKS